SIILENFSRYFRFPNSFESMIYLSQVQQALAIKTAVEYWRSLRPHCMGAIIWQLNDVWPVASWSSIEYSGKWKLLHYATKDFYAPFAVFPYKKDGKVYINVVNDCASKKSCSVNMRLIDFAGTVVKSEIKKLTVASDSVESFLYEEDFSTDVFLHLQLLDEKNEVCFENQLFSSYYKESTLQNPQISIDIEQNQNKQYEITLKSNAPAFFTSLDIPQINGVFSKNIFTLLPNEPQKILFTPNKSALDTKERKSLRKPTLSYVKKEIKIATLFHSY
ncbi:MAG: glycoside hydrolase family 2 protein, partial [Treponemataceae bacterium]